MKVYEVSYYEPTTRRWIVAKLYSSRRRADEKAAEIRIAGREARVSETDLLNEATDEEIERSFDAYR